MQPEAILWDYDGTIIDTNKKNYNVAKQVILSIKQNYQDNNLPLSLQSFITGFNRSSR